MCCSSCSKSNANNNSVPNKSNFYHITFNSNGGTSVEEQFVEKGENITKPNDPEKEGYTFTYWSYQNVEYLFDAFAPTSDMTLDANWSICSYDISLSNNEEYGSVSGAGTYNYGSQVTLNVIPHDGYEFAGWVENDQVVSESSTYSFNMPSRNINLTTKYNLKEFSAVVTNDSTCGTIAGAGKYKYKENVILNATPNTGYLFDGWYQGNQIVCATERYTFSMPAYDVLLKTKYRKQQVTLTVLNSDSMAGTLAGNQSGQYDYGSQITVTASPNHPYMFNGWFINNEIVSNTPSYSFAITKDTSITAKWGLSSFNISLENENTNAGTITGSGTYLYGIPVTLSAIANTGYMFNGWYKGNTLFSNQKDYTFNMPGENLSLVAKWDLIAYSITYNLNQGTNSELNPSTYNVEDSFTFSSPVRTGYTFLGWFDESGNQITKIERGSTGGIILTAYWNEGNCYIISLDSNDGIVLETTIDVQYDHSYSLPIPTRLGYTFDGWFENTSKINSSGIWKIAGDKTLVAHWNIIHYEINYNLDNGTNNPSNPSTYTVEDNIIFASPTRNGYTFVDWYDGENTVTEILQGTTGDKNITARWSANKNNLTVISEDTSKGTVYIASGSGYTDESITVVASPIGECVFKGWYHDSKLVSDESTYTFNMPSFAYSLVARFFTQQEEHDAKLGIKPISLDGGKTFTYGLYPQKYVNDSTIISALDSIETPEANGWYLYNNEYYVKINGTPRGSLYYKFDDGTEIISGATYWFKCEPIVWNVLSNNSGTCYVLSKNILDAQFYNKNYSGLENEHYANNYEFSEIRDWLNNDFYYFAFALNDSIIETTNVDNGASTTMSYDNVYACNNTFDKVFLPSYKDYFNIDYGFSSPSSRYCKTTEWARARGAGYYFDPSDKYLNGQYCTRSPATAFSTYISEIESDGQVYSWQVNNKYGIRPALNITIV